MRNMERSLSLNLAILQEVLWELDLPMQMIYSPRKVHLVLRIHFQALHYLELVTLHQDTARHQGISSLTICPGLIRLVVKTGMSLLDGNPLRDSTQWPAAQASTIAEGSPLMIVTLLAQVVHLKSHLVAKHRKRNLIIGMLFSWPHDAVDLFDHLSFTIQVQVCMLYSLEEKSLPQFPRVKIKRERESMYNVLHKRGDCLFFIIFFRFLSFVWGNWRLGIIVLHIEEMYVFLFSLMIMYTFFFPYFCIKRAFFFVSGQKGEGNLYLFSISLYSFGLWFYFWY